VEQRAAIRVSSFRSTLVLPGLRASALDSSAAESAPRAGTRGAWDSSCLNKTIEGLEPGKLLTASHLNNPPVSLYVVSATLGSIDSENETNHSRAKVGRRRWRNP
jgi:hypothetical protein